MEFTQDVLDSELISAFSEIYPCKMYTNDDPKKSVRYLAKTKFTVVLSFKSIIEDMWYKSEDKNAYKNLNS